MEVKIQDKALAHQLLVYQQYKEASEWLKELADTRALYARRGQNAEEGRRLAEALQRESYSAGESLT